MKNADGTPDPMHKVHTIREKGEDHRELLKIATWAPVSNAYGQPYLRKVGGVTWVLGMSCAALGCNEITVSQDFAHAFQREFLGYREDELIEHEDRPMNNELTDRERLVVDRLAAAWNAFLELPVDGRQDDVTEFRHGIHRLQEKILARPARRNYDMLRSS